MNQPRPSLPAMVALLLALAMAGGCAYRLSHPPSLGEAVQVRVVYNDARLVRAQPYLQASVAQALEQRLGWTVSPVGSARLDLVLDTEVISAVGIGNFGIPSQWSITVRGHAILVSHHGSQFSAFQGSATASSLQGSPGSAYTIPDDEASALHIAADNAALSLTSWLQGIAVTWQRSGTAPTTVPAPAATPAPPARSAGGSTVLGAPPPLTLPAPAGTASPTP